MKIAYVTTMAFSNENKRIREEVEKLGHKFVQVSMASLETKISNGKIVDSKLLESKPDMLIVRGILGSLKTITALVNHMRQEGIKVFDNNFLDHQYSISKITDMVKLSLNEIPIPDTYHLREFDDYFSVSEKLKYPLIVKSNRTGKGRGVFKADDEIELKELINNLIENGKQPKHYVIQEFIPYVYDIRALIIGKKVYAMRRIPGEGEFRANFSLGGAVELFELDKETRDLSIKALEAVGMSVGGVDVLITKDGNKYVLEVNHNAGFTGMEKATNENIAKVFVEHAIKQAR